jgi:hypothetical protein
VQGLKIFRIGYRKVNWADMCVSTVYGGEVNWFEVIQGDLWIEVLV